MTGEGVWNRMSGCGDESSVFVQYGLVIGLFAQVAASLKRFSCREDSNATKRSISEGEKSSEWTDFD